MKDLKEISFLFLKLGVIAFGGPAAHIAMMEDEVVTKKKWMTRQHFLDLIGATNLIPGPNSTEMAIHCGYHKAGIPGLIAAGICFILPAVLITGFLAYLYVEYGTLPEVEPFLYGIKPAVIVIIINAIFKLGKKAFAGWKIILIGAAVVVVNLSGTNEIFSILIGGLFGALFIYLSEKKNLLSTFFHIPFLSVLYLSSVFADEETSKISLTKLFLIFLKIGSVLFGSGYVLIAYLDGELVQGLNLLSRQQLLDAVAIGQFTPGPVLSTATFIGYQLAGVSGAVIATLGIFLPSFIFVLIINPIIPRLRNSKIFSIFLDAVNASALAVMFVVALKLIIDTFIDLSTEGIDWRAVIIGLVSAAAFLSIKKINSVYIVLSGAVLGYLLYLLS